MARKLLLVKEGYRNVEAMISFKIVRWSFKMRSEYTNYGQLRNRIKELEIELKEERLAAKFDREDKKLCNFLVDNIPDIIFRLNAFGKIVYVNNAVKTYGYEPETLIGRDILDFVHPDDVDKVKHQIKEGLVTAIQRTWKFGCLPGKKWSQREFFLWHQRVYIRLKNHVKRHSWVHWELPGISPNREN
jgi:PAS domain-containing protein